MSKRDNTDGAVISQSGKVLVSPSEVSCEARLPTFNCIICDFTIDKDTLFLSLALPAAYMSSPPAIQPQPLSDCSYHSRATGVFQKKLSSQLPSRHIH
jgi:hypothetical protein